MNRRVGFVCGGSHKMKITDSKVWKDFIDSLNNPSQEVTTKRDKFFEECAKLIITKENDEVIHVESSDLNTEDILAALHGGI